MAETVVCVGGIVRRDDGVLLVRQSPGHSLEGLWTIPWGQLERGESPTAAVLREIEEEAGVIAQVDGLLGIQELPEPWLGMLGILFLCTHVSGTPRPDNHETDAARFFANGRDPAFDEPIEPLSAWLINRVLAGEFTLLEMNADGPYLPNPTYL